MGPLGARRIVDSPDGIGYARDRAALWITPRRRAGGAPPAAHRRGHVAIAAGGRRAVDAAHRAGLAAGGRDGGAPAPRPTARPTYYSGYLMDPDGAWLELVSAGR
jgi:hypothetical protein